MTAHAADTFFRGQQAVEGSSAEVTMRERRRMEYEMEALGFQYDTATDKKNVVLVGCFDSNFSGVDFELFCRHRIRRYLRDTSVYKDPNFIFTVFDVGRGKVKLFHLPAGKTKWEWKEDPTKTFIRVTAANYKGFEFKKKPEGVMSITDVYAYIRTLDAGSVRELSFFGHGWIDGPVLVNSFEADSFKSRVERDPNDKDGRAGKDFQKPNMSEAERKTFADAFHANGFVWAWGCSFEEQFRQVIHQVINKNPVYLKNPGKVKDTDEFSFVFNNKMATEFFKEDATFFPPKKDGKHVLKFKRSFKEVKEFFQRGIDRSYCKHAANAINKVCYGALPGTYSDIEKGKPLYLMLIPRNAPLYGANLARYIEFYKLYFGFTEDPESRGYGAFKP